MQAVRCCIQFITDTSVRGREPAPQRNAPCFKMCELRFCISQATRQCGPRTLLTMRRCVSIDSPRDSTVDAWHAPGFNTYTYNMHENDIYWRSMRLGRDEITARIEGALDFLQHMYSLSSRHDVADRLIEIFNSHGRDGLCLYMDRYNHQCRRLSVGT